MPWVRATCTKKWLFQGILCCGAVLGTNCHAWLSSKVMGMEVAPTVCWEISLVPHPSTHSMLGPFPWLLIPPPPDPGHVSCVR